MQLSPEQQAALEEQKQYCPFCKIVKGEIPASKVYEDGKFLAVLDINPAVTGHTLLIPKEHYPVFPFMPEDEMRALASLLPQISSSVQKAMIVREVQTFMANGAAAGQQASHFLMHIFPVDAPLLAMPSTPSAQANTLKTAIKSRFGDPKERISQMLSSNPGARELLVERPHDFSQQLANVPELAKMFSGIDIMTLSLQLSESHTPRAIKMEDEAFLLFVNSKEKLRELMKEPETLDEAVKTQPKIARFLEGTTGAQVAQRYKSLTGEQKNV